MSAAAPSSPIRVHIELQRVQTWLFAVPRLRAMVGANTLLGEVLRQELPDLACASGRPWRTVPCSGSYPPADSADPLSAHDDPSADAQRGILARDGGHFEVQLEGDVGAFVAAANKLLRSKLPGLRYRISVDKDPHRKREAHLSTELPVLTPCEWTGRGLASAIIKQGDDDPFVSLDVTRRHEAAKRSEEKGKALDLASLLNATTCLKEQKRAQELKELVGGGYLALIHADGNGVGSGAPRSEDPASRAAFFHRNRVLLRRAVAAAIDEVCCGETSAPLVPLMLGGDDLLLVCRAKVALPFVVALCAKLDELQKADDGFKLTLGAGVVFAKYTVPIHRLHDVAEQLASSAKRRFRGLKERGERERSVVDWAVYSTSWVDDPLEVRRRDWVRGEGAELRVLSQRPVDVLYADGSQERLKTLQGLVEASAALKDAPRSQLHYLAEQLPQGRALSELAFNELSAKTRDALSRAGVCAPWRRIADESSPWRTELLDLVEIAELPRMGSQENAQHNVEAS